LEKQMTDEVAAQPETTQDNVETPEAITDTPKEVEESQAEEKHFTQAELDVIVQKRIAKAEAVAERRALKVYAEKLESMQRPQQQAPQYQDDGKPSMGQYANVEDYVEAVADWKLAQRDQVSQRNAAEMSQKQVQVKTEKIYAEAAKIEGFDRDEFDSLPLTTPVAQAIIDSDIAPQLMAHLANNPSEATRIANLTPARQAAEIGKLEAKLQVTKDIKASSAPPPIKPVGSRGGNTAGDPSRMSMDEYSAYRSKQGARWAR
jgi:type II secretory pathway pseudopilin PulG